MIITLFVYKYLPLIILLFMIRNDTVILNDIYLIIDATSNQAQVLR